MIHTIRLAIEAGGSYDLAVYLGKQLDMLMRLRLHGKIGLLSFHSQRYALRAEAEIIRFSANDFQIFQQCGSVLRLRADNFKGCLFHIKCFLS